jgi:hypothetical protein
MNVIHFVEYPLPAGLWFTACGMRNAIVDYENITAEKDHVTCLRCRGTRQFWTLPLITKDK